MVVASSSSFGRPNARFAQFRPDPGRIAAASLGHAPAMMISVSSAPIWACSSIAGAMLG
jgi:hypothetical protein